MAQLFTDLQTEAIHMGLSVGIAYAIDLVFLDRWLFTVPAPTVIDYVIGLLVRVPVAVVLIFATMHIASLAMYALNKSAKIIVTKAGGTNDSK